MYTMKHENVNLNSIADTLFAAVWKPNRYRICIDFGLNNRHSLQSSLITDSAANLIELLVASFRTVLVALNGSSTVLISAFFLRFLTAKGEKSTRESIICKFDVAYGGS